MPCVAGRHSKPRMLQCFSRALLCGLDTAARYSPESGATGYQRYLTIIRLPGLAPCAARLEPLSQPALLANPAHRSLRTSRSKPKMSRTLGARPGPAAAPAGRLDRQAAKLASTRAPPGKVIHSIVVFSVICAAIARNHGHRFPPLGCSWREKVSRQLHNSHAVLIAFSLCCTLGAESQTGQWPDPTGENKMNSGRL